MPPKIRFSKDLDIISSADIVNNDSFIDVIGNKDDTDSGTSIVSLIKGAELDLSTIDGYHDVPSADSADNNQIRDVVGNKTDTTSGNSLVAINKQIVADTNELQTDWTNGGRLDLLLDAIKVSTDQVGTIVNTGGTAELGALLGDFNNITLVSRLDTIDDFLDTEIAAIKAVTDNLPDSGALTSIAQDSTVAKEATLGSPVTTISGDIAVIDSNVDAILVDTGTTLPGILGTPVTDIATDIATVDSNVDTLVSTNGSNDSSGTFVYLDAGSEQDVVEITTTTRKIIKGIWLDLVNLTQDGTIKCYHKIDGSNYREFYNQSFTVATDLDGTFLNLDIGITSDFKVTYTEGVDEGADRNIPYSIIYELKE